MNWEIKRFACLHYSLIVHCRVILNNIRVPNLCQLQDNDECQGNQLVDKKPPSKGSRNSLRNEIETYILDFRTSLLLFWHTINTKIPISSVLDHEVDWEATEDKEAGNENNKIEGHDFVNHLLHARLFESVLALVEHQFRLRPHE